MATLTSSARDEATRTGGSSRLRRAGIFVLGGVLNLLGAAAWLLSVLLTAPLLLAGLWVWSREFEWARRFLHRARGWAGSLWRRARAHPVRWGLTTAVSLGASATAYWLLMA